MFNGMVEIYNFELGYIGRNPKTNDKVIMVQFTGRQLGHVGTRLMLIPIPGTFKEFIDTNECGYYMYDSINQTTPMNATLPDLYSSRKQLSLRYPESISLDTIKLFCCPKGKNLANSISKHWEDAYLDYDFEKYILNYFPDWDIIVCQFDTKKLSTFLPIGFTYNGPEITDNIDTYLYYPFIYNIFEDSLYTDLPKLHTASYRNFALLASVNDKRISSPQSSRLKMKVTKVEVSPLLPDQLSTNVISYIWSNSALLNGGLLFNESTGAVRFTTDVCAMRIDKEVIKIDRAR